MKEFEHIEVPVLIDILADYTADYSRMLSEGAYVDDIKSCENKIILLQNEISKRKNISMRVPIPKPGVDHNSSSPRNR